MDGTLAKDGGELARVSCEVGGPTEVEEGILEI